MMETERLLWLCFEGSATDEQYREAWRWIHESPANRQYFREMRDLWFVSSWAQPIESSQIELGWQKMQRALQPARGKNRHIWRWIKIAAVILITFSVGFATHKWTNRVEHIVNTETCTVEASKGSRSQIMLPDGTKVWLNAGSKLDFDAGFKQETRNVRLQGEAFFEVAHKPDKAFLVFTSGIVIRVLGTTFNVKAYPEDNTIETTLVEGSIRIEKMDMTTNNFKPFEIHPNQSVRFYKKEPVKMPEDKVLLQTIEKIEIAEQVNIEKYTSWKDKQWIFDGERMSNFSKIIERIYNVAVFFDDEELKNYKLSGTLEEETLEELLNAIRLTIPMDYRIAHNKVYLSINQQLKKEYEKVIKQN
jgi:ferric-dicitrate binding protein FerR (iron transport regulator)